MAVRRARGHTLIEALLTVAVVSVLASVAAPLMAKATEFWRQTKARIETERDARAALDVIDRFARQAKSATVVVDSASGQPPASRLSFVTGQGVSVSFWQSGATLYASVGGRVSKLAANVGYLALAYPRSDDTALLSVSLTALVPTGLGRSKSLQLTIQKVRLMN